MTNTAMADVAALLHRAAPSLDGYADQVRARRRPEACTIVLPVREGLVSADINDSYIFYIGFDPQALKPETKPKAAKKK